MYRQHSFSLCNSHSSFPSLRDSRVREQAISRRDRKRSYSLAMQQASKRAGARCRASQPRGAAPLSRAVPRLAAARCRASQPRFKRNRRRAALRRLSSLVHVRSCCCHASWAACTALELKARCARDVPFAFTVVFRVATIRSRPDAVGKGTLLVLKAYISILNSVGNFKNPHLLLKKLTRASFRPTWIL